MSNAIQFLEALGRTPLSAAGYAATVTALHVEEAQRKALLERDHITLNDLIDGRTTMLCVLSLPDDLASDAAPGA